MMQGNAGTGLDGVTPIASDGTGLDWGYSNCQWPLDADPTHGTIDKVQFEYWIEHFFCLVFGNYKNFEWQSVAVGTW
jgi:hypothetical protein